VESVNSCVSICLRAGKLLPLLLRSDLLLRSVLLLRSDLLLRSVLLLRSDLLLCSVLLLLCNVIQSQGTSMPEYRRQLCVSVETATVAMVEEMPVIVTCVVMTAMNVVEF